MIREAKETRATRLDLGTYCLYNIPNELFELTWLEELNLSSGHEFKDNQLKNIIIEVTTENEISLLPNDITKLKKLRLLALSNLKITDFNVISNFIFLEKLYLNHCELIDVNFASKLSNLILLEISSTKVKDLIPLKNLTTLQSLYVSSTQVSDLSPLKKIIEKGIEVKWEKYGSGIMIEGCPLSNPPQEIVEQGNAAILRYWKQIEKQGGTVELYEAKMIIVGEGGTGKTTLFEKMKDVNHQVGNTPETHGIIIKEGLEIPHRDIGDNIFHANLWDFGGQELQYMTHQFFLTPRAFYVLMMDARKESLNLTYWFKIISLLGKDSETSTEKRNKSL